MPWKVTSGRKECSGYAVVDEKGKIVGCHRTKAEATAQQRALYASEADKSIDHNKEEDDERTGRHRNESHKFWDGVFIEKGYN